MSTISRVALLAMTLVALGATLPHALSAQRAATLRIVAGPTQYDLSGTGWAPFAALRAHLPLAGRLGVEPGLGWMSYETQGGTRTQILLPEAQLQFDLLGGSVRPYLGAGAGGALAFADGESDSAWTLSGAGGVNARLAAGWTIGGELRIRSIDPFTGVTADWGLVLGRRL